MSAGGANSSNLSGITSMRLRDASDNTVQTRVRLVYQTFNSTTGANAYQGDTVNPNGYYDQYIAGIKECAGCAGLPYSRTATLSFRNPVMIG